jgi:hypothetical protein
MKIVSDLLLSVLIQDCLCLKSLHLNIQVKQDYNHNNLAIVESQIQLYVCIYNHIYIYILLLTVDFADDLCNDIHWRERTLIYLWPEIVVLQLQKLWAECSRVLCVWDKIFIFFIVLCRYSCGHIWLLGLFETKSLTNEQHH